MGHREEVAPARRDGGFTLLELIITLLVIALAVGLTVPAIGRTSEGIRVRAEIAGFSAVLRHARELAITSHAPHAVVIDTTARRMTIRSGGPEGDVRQSRPLPARLTVTANPPAALIVRFQPQGTSDGGDFRLVSGAATYHVTVDPLTGRVRSMRE
jgi:prepilin-type N-terminal cleavage/methylation domain-containing protein